MHQLQTLWFLQVWRKMPVSAPPLSPNCLFSQLRAVTSNFFLQKLEIFRQFGLIFRWETSKKPWSFVQIRTLDVQHVFCISIKQKRKTKWEDEKVDWRRSRSVAAGIGTESSKVEIDWLWGIVPRLWLQSKTPFGFNVMVPI